MARQPRPCVCDLHLAPLRRVVQPQMLEKTFYMAGLDLDRPAVPGGRRRPGGAREDRGPAGGRRARSRSSRPRRCREVRPSRARARSSGTRARYETADLEGRFLVIAATSDTAAQRARLRRRRAPAMLVNVVDVPPLCNFILPAIVRTGPIAIAISTSGASPALAKRLKREIAEPSAPRTRAWPRSSTSCAAGRRTRSPRTRSAATSSRTSSTASPTRSRCCARATRRRSAR